MKRILAIEKIQLQAGYYWNGEHEQFGEEWNHEILKRYDVTDLDDDKLAQAMLKLARKFEDPEVYIKLEFSDGREPCDHRTLKPHPNGIGWECHDCGRFIGNISEIEKELKKDID